MVIKQVSHKVTRPGRTHGDADITISVADELITTPGIPKKESDLSFYSRTYPLESQTIEKTADRDWTWSVFSDEVSEYLTKHIETTKPMVDIAEKSATLDPTGTPDPSIDMVEAIRLKARELGFGEVGFTRYDRRYTFKVKKGWVKFEHAICLALEQDYRQTQTIPSMEAEYAHYGTYEDENRLGIILAEYIRELGYHAQIHSPNDNSAAYIPMFVEAGLGQLGANGQLLSPHFGSRARLMIITTDAPVIHDTPIDYGIHKFCDICQVCVNRCPGRALVKEKVWWRGAEKNKLIYERCRPVMAKYEGCGVCMKVCPVQKYGMQPVMAHFVETGEVLGKDTHNLEGYTIEDRGGYFGPGKLPKFSRDFFEIPKGNREDWLFDQFKKKLKSQGGLDSDSLGDFGSKLSELLEVEDTSRGDE
jgi:ferredoxin